MPRTDFQRRVVCLLGLPFDAVTMDEAVAQVRRDGLAGTRCFISTPNLNFLIAARGDAAFRDSVIHSHLSLADGMPLVWMARLLRLPVRERVSGAGLFERLKAHAAPSLGVYFFGGPPGMAQKANERLRDDGQGGVHGVGFASPGFGSVAAMSDEDTLAAINASRAHFLVVALGAKKGQAWIEHNGERLAPPLLCHLGAVVNFVAGSVQRAPRWVQACGMEWLWRIKEEPALWRRYWGDGVAFLRLFVGRVLPHALWLRRHRPLATEVQAASVAFVPAPHATVLRLRGAWIEDNLAPLRAALAEADQDPSRSGRPLVIDLAGVSHGDSAFLGMMLLARAAWRSPGGLRLEGCSAGLRRIFRYHAVEYLLSSDNEERQAEGAPA